MDVLICDVNPAVVSAAARIGFKTHLGSILDVPGVLVSPANSFGFMDGGIDAVYSQAYPRLEGEVQRQIIEECGGELPVGQALTVRNYDSFVSGGRHHFVIVAPTMRTPATNLRGTLNAYLAAKAAYDAFKRIKFAYHGLKHTLLMPGLGTASGRMDAEVAVQQMAAGISASENGAVRYATWHEQKSHEDQLLGLKERRW